MKAAAHEFQHAVARGPCVGPRPPAPGILTRVLDRPRTVPLAWAGACAALFLLLALLVHLQRAPLSGLDDFGHTAANWASDSPGLNKVLRVIEVAFGTIGMTVWTTLIVAQVAAAVAILPVSLYLVSEVVRMEASGAG